MKDTVILQKLHKTCKYFFLIRPTPICYRFVIASRSPHHYSLMPNNTHTKALNFDEQSLIITAENPSIKNLKNLYITNYVYIQSVFNVLRLSNILKCIWKCEIKYLTIENQTMLFKDYQLLTKAKTVKEIKFMNAQIWDENGFLTQLEEIMETLPNAVYIDFKNFPATMGHPYGRNMIAQEINDQTFKKLSNLKRNKKIQHFSLTILNQLFDPFSFIQFVEDNLDDNGSKFYLHFGNYDINNNDERMFQENSFLSISNYVTENRQPEKKIFGSVIIHGRPHEISFAL